MSLYLTAFSARDQHVVSFLHCAHYFLTIFSKAHEFSKTAFWARDQNVLSFSPWAHHFLARFSKTHEFVQNSVFSPRSGRFVIFLVGALLFSHFVQSTEFSPRSACFVISALGEPFVSQSERVCAIPRFVPEIRTFSYFTHWAHPFLAVCSKVNGFVENSSFSPG